MGFFIFLSLIVVCYFLYNIAENIGDVRDELRAANRRFELQDQASKAYVVDVSDI
ncbi:MAG: hypothetical protein V4629_08115 [Pseudomonadota bacterium]